MISKHTTQGGQGGVRDLPRGRDHPRPIRRHGPPGTERRADDRHRNEELPRGVHPRRALQAGARGEGLQRLVQGEPRLDGADPDRAHERQDQLLPRVHGRDRRRSSSTRRSRRRRRAATYALAKQLEAAKGFTLLNADAVLRHRRGRGDERDGEEVRAEVDRRPEEGRQLQARRLPGVQDAEHVLRRLHEAVRAQERVVRAARGHLGLRGARRRARCSRRTCSRPTRRSARARSTRCSPTRST